MAAGVLALQLDYHGTVIPPLGNKYSGSYLYAVHSLRKIKFIFDPAGCFIVDCSSEMYHELEVRSDGDDPSVLPDKSFSS